MWLFLINVTRPCHLTFFLSSFRHFLQDSICLWFYALYVSIRLFSTPLFYLFVCTSVTAPCYTYLFQVLFFFFTTLYAYFSLYYTLWVSVYLFCHFIYISEIFYVYFIFEFYTELIVPFVAARRTIFEYLRLFGSVIIENTAIYII